MTETGEGSSEPEGELAAALEGVETEVAYTLVRLAIDNQRANFDALVEASRLSRDRMDQVWGLVRRAVEGGAGPTRRG